MATTKFTQDSAVQRDFNTNQCSYVSFDDHEPLQSDSEEVVLRVLNGKLQLTFEKPEKSQNFRINGLCNTKTASSKEKMYAADGGFTSPETKENNSYSRAPIVPDYYPSIQNGVETDANSSVPTETETIQRFLSVCFRQFIDNNQVPNGAQVNENTFPLYNGEAGRNEERDNRMLLNIGTGDSPHTVRCTYCDSNDRTNPRQSNLEKYHSFALRPSDMRDDMEREKLLNNMEVTLGTDSNQFCTYREFGCAFEGSKENMEDHLDENLEEHLQFACDVIQEQRTEMELMRERLRKQDDAMCQLTESVTKLKAIVGDHITAKDAQEKAINRLSEQAKEQKRHQGKLEKDTKYKIAELQNKLDGAEGINIPSVRTELMRYPGLNGYGEQVWRITNVTRRLQRVQSRRGDDPTTSEPFYSSAFGYKMSAWIYINGRGKEESQCLSLYVCVTCGEYDAILKWPIKPKYTFMLLDQSLDAENRKDLVRTRRVNDFKRDDVRQKGIERPLPNERAIIVGFDDFISHEELETSPRYLVDDTIFIRVLADIRDDA